MDEDKIKIVAIFRTLDGECTLGGPLQWSTFVRFGGCNLRCWKSSGFCDAPHTLDMHYPYPQMTISQIIKEVQTLGVSRVTITGGEPLMQKDLCILLAARLRDIGYKVTLETSGSILMSKYLITAFGCVVMDLKPPSTEMVKLNKYENNSRLRLSDYIKFVLSNREDFDWALDVLETHPTAAQVAMGPRFGHLEPREILEWLGKANKFSIRLNMQLHKYIWPSPEPRYDDLKQVPYDLLVKGER